LRLKIYNVKIPISILQTLFWSVFFWKNNTTFAAIKP
jgi:hypothetical protein